MTPACGLDSAASSTPYVAGWSGGDPTIIEAAAILGDLYAAEVKEDQAAKSPAEEPAAAAA